MSRVAGSRPDHPIAGNIPATDYPNAPGEWQVCHAENGDRRMQFGCQFRPGQSCGVFLKPHSYETEHKAHAWTWDGNPTEPTLSPSINCIKDPPKSYGCGWHGFIRAGRVVNA